MLKKLVNLFESNKNKKVRVRISHTNNLIPTSEGVCITVNEVPGFKNHFVMVLDTGEHFMFIPENVGVDFVEGQYVYSMSKKSRRKIQVVADEK